MEESKNQTMRYELFVTGELIDLCIPNDIAIIKISLLPHYGVSVHPQYNTPLTTSMSDGLVYHI